MKKIIILFFYGKIELRKGNFENDRKKLKESYIDEKLKAENQLEWVKKMNNIKNRANEIVFKEFIYV